MHDGHGEHHHGEPLVQQPHREWPSSAACDPIAACAVRCRPGSRTPRNAGSGLLASERTACHNDQADRNKLPCGVRTAPLGGCRQVLVPGVVKNSPERGGTKVPSIIGQVL